MIHDGNIYAQLQTPTVTNILKSTVNTLVTTLVLNLKELLLVLSIQRIIYNSKA